MLKALCLLTIVVLVRGDDTMDKLLSLLKKESNSEKTNQKNKVAIEGYEQCKDISKFDSRILGYWRGRDAINAVQSHLVYDRHRISDDGSGVLSRLNEADPAKLVRARPDMMWCRTNANGVDKELKVQYGPTEYGVMTCVDLAIPHDKPDEMLVTTNLVLYADPRVPHDPQLGKSADCLYYRTISTNNGYLIQADMLESPANVVWVREVNPPNPGDTDWEIGKRLEHLLEEMKKKEMKKKSIG